MTTSLLLVLVMVALLLVGLLAAYLVYSARRLARLSAPAPSAGEEAAAAFTRMRESGRNALARLNQIGRRGVSSERIPHCLLLGPTGAGKSELLRSVVRDGEARDHAGSALHWWYLARGVIIEASGLLLNAAGDELWREALSSLVSYRPRRPLDSVLLVIPAESLAEESAGAGRFSLAAALRDRLQSLQAAVGFTLPVYVLVSRCDRLAGFSAFASELDAAQRQQMIGWASPYDPSEVFQGQWAEQCISEICRSVSLVQLELFAAGGGIQRSGDAILLPASVARLQAPLRQMLDEVFRHTAYQTHLQFRGVWLAGDANAQNELATVSDEGEQSPRSIAFAADVLNSKVLAEPGLAVPLFGTLSANHRTRRRARLTAALLAAVLFAGTLLALVRLSRAASSYEALLSDITPHGRNDVRSAYNVMQAMSALGGDRLSSIFVPASFFTPEPHLTEAITTAFSNLVLPAFAAGLEARARPDQRRRTADSEPAVQIPSLDAIPQYVSLREAADEYNQFVLNAERYERIRSLRQGDLKDLVDLADYLIGSKNRPLRIPREPYAAALKRASAEPLPCLINDARAVVAVRAVDFFRGWYGSRNPLLIASERLLDAWQMERADLRQVRTALAELEAASAKWNWLANEFDPSRYPPLLTPALAERPDPSPAFSCAVAPSPILANTRALHEDFRQHLLGEADVHLGNLVDDKLALSENVRKLKAALDDMERQGFLANTSSSRTLRPPVRWSPATLDQVTARLAAFESYRPQLLRAVPASIGLRLGTLADHAVAGVALDQLYAEALQGEAAPTDADNVAAVDAYIKEITAFGQSIERLSKLDGRVRQIRRDEVSRLRQAVATQASQDLAWLTTLARQWYPHLFARPSELRLPDEWRQAQGGGASVDWGDFVDEQSADIRTLGVAAGPLAELLRQSAPDADGTIARWKGIAEDVRRFDKKAPDNGLQAFDTFFRKELAGIAPDKGCPAPPLLRVQSSALKRLRDSLSVVAVRDCLTGELRSVRERYRFVARGFRDNLLGKFPFAASVGQDDAQAEDLRRFYRVFDQQAGPSLAPELARLGCPEPAARFAASLLRGRALAAGLLADPDAFPALDVIPEFRVNRDREVGGSEIADWRLDIGRRTYTGPAEPEQPLRWTAGDTMRLTLRFANQSPHVPVGGAADQKLVSDRVVLLEYRGQWSLLSMLRALAANREEIDGPVESGVYTLRISLPVKRDPTRPGYASGDPGDVFRVYLRLRLLIAGQKTAAQVDALPAQAPELNTENCKRGNGMTPAFQFESEPLLSPISASAPGGESLRYEGAYDRIRELRREDDPNLDQGVWKTDLKRADWRAVERECLMAIETRSKDLQIAAWLLEAWLQLHGFVGLREGLKLMGDLCESFWPYLHPAVEDGDFEFRMAPFHWIDEKVVLRVKQVPVSSPFTEEEQAYSLSDWEYALRPVERRRGAQAPEPRVTQPRFQRSMVLTPTAWLYETALNVRGCMEALERLEHLLEGLAGDHAITFPTLSGTLEAALNVLSSYLNERSDLPAPPPVAGASEFPAEPAGTIPNRIRTRAEAYQRLAEAADYLMRTEPHSPVPYLVRRAIAWGSLTLDELLPELVRNSNELSEIFRLLQLNEVKQDHDE